MDGIEVQPVRTAEEVAVFAGLCRAYAASLPFIAVSLQHQGFEGELASLPGKYAPPRGEMFLAWDSGGGAERSALGCVAVRPLDDEAGACELKRMFVLPSARGRGVGMGLASRAVGWARGAGYVRMRLDTDRSMSAAMGVYRRLGFVECEPYNTDPCPDTLWFVLEL